MKHSYYEQLLQLSLYDEITVQQKKLLEEHIKTCAQCRNDRLELKALLKTVARRQVVAPQNSLLQEVRRNLRQKIHARHESESFIDKIRNIIDEFWSPPIRVALGGLTILAAGIILGYYGTTVVGRNPFQQQVSTASSLVEPGESQISNIRFLDRDEQTGDVEFTFETVTPVRIRGNVRDERVQQVLARAMISNQNVGTRLRAVNMIGTHAEQSRSESPELHSAVKTALITALLHDKNLGVRKEALDVLKNYLPDPDIVRAFLDVLEKENNTGLKIAAINSLDLSKRENSTMNQEILDMLKQTAQSDNNNYIRIKAKAALQEVQQ